MWTLTLLKGKLRPCCLGSPTAPSSSSSLVGKIVGIWPKDSQSTQSGQWPVTWLGLKHMSRANQILTLGNLIQKTPRAEPVRKGAETVRVPGSRVEATKSQSHMQAKVMKQQKLWVNRKLTGSKQRVRPMPGAGEHSAVRRRQLSPGAALASDAYTAPPCAYCPLTPSSSGSLSESGLCYPRNQIGTANRSASTFQIPTY